MLDDDARVRDEPEGLELAALGAVDDDSARWDALAVRVAREAVRRAGPVGLLGGDIGPWVLAASIVAAAGLILLVSTRPATSSSRAQWLAMLAPNDVTARALAAAEVPPSIGALMLDGGMGGR